MWFEMRPEESNLLQSEGGSLLPESERMAKPVGKGLGDACPQEDALLRCCEVRTMPAN